MNATTQGVAQNLYTELKILFTICTIFSFLNKLTIKHLGGSRLELWSAMLKSTLYLKATFYCTET